MDSSATEIPKDPTGDPVRIRLREEGVSALADLWGEQVSKLERIVQFRMDPYVRARIDPADVLQEAFLQVVRRVQEYIDGVSVSWFVWLRQRTMQTLIDMQRAHLSENATRIARYRVRTSPMDRLAVYRSRESWLTIALRPVWLHIAQ